MNHAGRIAITGIGVCTALGQTPEEFIDGLREGRSAGAPIEGFDTTGHLSRIGAEIRGFDPSPVLGRKRTRRMARFSQMASFAAKQAVERSGVDLAARDPQRQGVVIGTAAGDYEHLEAEHRTLLEKGPGNGFPLAVPLIIPNMSSANVAIDLGITGPNLGVATACSSGSHAIAMAAMMLRAGITDVMVGGGAEAAITPLTVNAYGCMGVLTRRNDDPARASRPFDRDRDGFLIGEGAAALVMEREADARARGAEILAFLDGIGMTTDAHSIAIPEPDGTSAAAAMTMALRDAGVDSTDLDYINAHGTSTGANDRTETKAIRHALGTAADRVAVSSTKSMLGHTLGAAGAIEAAATILSVQHQVMPPTINYENPDPDCDLDYVPNTARETRIRHAISNSFGFGGQNGALLFSATDA